MNLEDTSYFRNQRSSIYLIFHINKTKSFRQSACPFPTLVPMLILIIILHILDNGTSGTSATSVCPSPLALD